MQKCRQYKFKKIYLEEKVFKIDNNEVKSGYLNINGLDGGYHAEYLDADHNLKNLDILVLAETKLDKNTKNDQIIKVLSNWNIIGRYDSDDGSKHMGLILLTSKKSSINDQIQSITHQSTSRQKKLQIQGLIVRLIKGINFGFFLLSINTFKPRD